MENREVERLAQAAKTIAERAEQSISSHERICTERYGRINQQLGEAKTALRGVVMDQRSHFTRLYEAIDGLKSTANKAAGIDIAIRYGVLLLGAVGIVFGFFRGH